MAQTKLFQGTARAITSVTGNGMAYSYHGTPVVTLYADRVVFNSGGYRTATTLRAMNQALSQNALAGHIRVYQRKGTWYVDINDLTLEFMDGITVTRVPS